MRYCSFVIIFLTLLLWSVTGEATPLQVGYPPSTVSHGASFSKGSIQTGSKAENVSTPQVIAPLKAREQKSSYGNWNDDAAVIAKPSYSCNDFSLRFFPSENAQGKSLLFPNHYFW